MTSYAAQKGRAAPVAKSATDTLPPPLTEAAEARIEANKGFVLNHMPELLQTIRALHADGMIDGWRSVLLCTLLDESGNE